MSYSPELLHKIISYYLDNLNDTLSQVNKHVIHEDWLAVHHTNPQFHDLLCSPGLKDRNPYKEFSADFEGQTNYGQQADFPKASDMFSLWTDHVNALQSATPFSITLTMKFMHCLAVPPEDLHSVFAGLRMPHVAHSISYSS